MVGFVKENGYSFAGKHLLVDFYDCSSIPEHNAIELKMVDACIATGATVLFHHSHPFEGGGSSGVVVLAESHGTWHSWTEEKFVAVDIFVCGDCQPEMAIDILSNLFEPGRISVKLEQRGVMPDRYREFKFDITNKIANCPNAALI
jgi:S-adenosylmethionine decarboxylase